MVPLPGKACPVCGERPYSVYANSVAGEALVWPVGRRVEMPLDCAVTYGSYDGGLREPVHLLKYDGARAAANVRGRMSAEAMAEPAGGCPRGSGGSADLIRQSGLRAAR